jgi:hypothetical protein
LKVQQCLDVSPCCQVGPQAIDQTPPANQASAAMPQSARQLQAPQSGPLARTVGPQPIRNDANLKAHPVEGMFGCHLALGHDGVSP